MKLVSRKEWGARAPKAAASYLPSTSGVKVHYTGSTESQRAHEKCAARVRGIQDGHMDGNGWNDVGYSFLVCQHGSVFVGRGLHHLPAANGPGLNTGHYAVCGLVGNKGVVRPSDAMLSGIRDAIDYCRRSGDAGNEIKGHRDGYSTDCPGGPLYAWVKKGAPRPSPVQPPKPTPTPAPTPTEDDMPNGTLAEGKGAITPISLPKGRFKTIGFTADNTLQELPPASLRVAVFHGTWKVEEVTVDSSKQAVVTFTDAANVSGISVRREDAGDVHVGYEVS